MYKAYRYRLYPTPTQATQLVQSMGSCRFIYNWALQEKIAHYQTTGKSLSCFALMKRLPELKTQYEWLSIVPSQSLQQAISHLDAAFTAFFKKTGGFPKFKSKHRSRGSFLCPQGCSVDFEANRISVPKCKGIKARLSRKFEGVVKTVTISQSKSGGFYASVLVDDGQELPAKASMGEASAIGIDVGIKDFAILSSGEKIANPKHLANSEARLKVLQRRMSRKGT